MLSVILVSTHSRAEAAAGKKADQTTAKLGFNTQPRGGGCLCAVGTASHRSSFNTQPRGGGCFRKLYLKQYHDVVSTHSRAEAAAIPHWARFCDGKSFNTQPRGGGCKHSNVDGINLIKFQHTAARRRLPWLLGTPPFNPLCFNTQPRGGGCSQMNNKPEAQMKVSTHSRAEAAALCIAGSAPTKKPFQHTAARRRLHLKISGLTAAQEVSTHSRAEAAATFIVIWQVLSTMFQHTAARRRLQLSRPLSPPVLSFNTQPRGGGCRLPVGGFRAISPFQHTAARRRLLKEVYAATVTELVSTHSRAEAAAQSA